MQNHHDMTISSGITCIFHGFFLVFLDKRQRSQYNDFFNFMEIFLGDLRDKFFKIA